MRHRVVHMKSLRTHRLPQYLVIRDTVSSASRRYISAQARCNVRVRHGQNGSLGDGSMVYSAFGAKARFCVHIIANVRISPAHRERRAPRIAHGGWVPWSSSTLVPLMRALLSTPCECDKMSVTSNISLDDILRSPQSPTRSPALQ